MLSSLLMLAAASAPNPEATDAAPLDEITVEASKRPLATTDIAARVSVIDDERIERELAQTVADLVRYEPGVDVADQGSRFGFSGIAIRGVGGNRVRTEVDGVALSDAFSIGSFSNAGRDFVDVANIRQVEIIRGPGSALFGSDAIGGVVSFVTKGPADYLIDDATHLTASAGYNGIDSSTVASTTAAAAFGATSAMLRLTARDGSERDAPGADPMSASSVGALAKLYFGDQHAGALGVTLDVFDAEQSTDARSLERSQDFTETFGFPYLVDTTDVTGDDERRRQRISLGQEWVGGQFGTDYLRWRTFWQLSETTQDTFEARDTVIAGRSGASERVRSFQFEQELAGIELNAVNAFQLRRIENELAYGVEFETAETSQLRDGTELDLVTGSTSNTVGPDVFPLRDFPESRTSSLGLYLQNRMTLGAVTLVPGLRWDRYELDARPDAIFIEDNPGVDSVDLTDEQLSPKLGVLLDVGERWQLYGQYAEGFRAPPVNDVNVGFTNFQFGYTALANPELKSESSRGYELGLRYSGEYARVDLAAFTTRYTDFIESFQVVDFDPVNQLLIFQSVNVDAVDIEGVELKSRFSPTIFPEGLSLHLSAAYANGENRATGAPINSVSPLNGVAGLDYTQPGNNWGFSLLARAAAGVDELDETEADLLQPAGYVVYDATGFWQATERLRLSLGAYNLGDRNYTAYLDVQGVAADIDNPERFRRPGRHVSVAVNWEF